MSEGFVAPGIFLNGVGVLRCSFELCDRVV